MLYKYYRKLLWLSYRLNITFKFFLKIFIIFKVFSISYDIYLGYYPKIFNDQGFLLRFYEFLNYLDFIFLNYYHEVFFFFLVFCILSNYYWPYFFDVRIRRWHVSLRKTAEKEAKRLYNEKLNVFFNFEKKFKAKLDKYFWPFSEEDRVYRKKARIRRKKYRKGIRAFLRKLKKKK